MDVEQQSIGATADGILVALRRIIRAVDLHSRDLVQRFGLTGPQVMVLREVKRAGGQLSIGTLATLIHLSQATVTGIVERLEQRGLVRRSRADVDKRRVMVTLTEQGGSVLEQAPPLLQEHFVSKLAKLEDWEQTQILASLQRVVQMMEARHLDAGGLLDGVEPEAESPEPVSAEGSTQE